VIDLKMHCENMKLILRVCSYYSIIIIIIIIVFMFCVFLLSNVRMCCFCYKPLRCWISSK